MSSASYPQSVSGQDTAVQKFSVTNPFAAPSPLLYQAPPFDKIHNSDYMPAIEEGMRQQLLEIDSIASNPAPATFDNTIVSMERSGELLTRVAKIFFAVVQSNTDDELQGVQSEEAPKLAAHNDAIYLNDKLFQRVKTIYDNRESLHLGPVQEFLVRRYYIDFVRSGALLSEPDKEQLRSLNQEEAKLVTDFQNRLLGATKAGVLVIDDKSQLAGLSDADIAAAAQAAHDRGLDGKWVLPLQNTTQQPAQVSLSDRSVRERLFQSSTMRAERGDTDDTRDIIARLAEIREEHAKLLSFPNYAAYVLEDQMAKTPEAAIKLLTDLVPAATAKAQGESKKMQEMIDRQNGGFQLQPWDWQYYAEKVRKAEYDLDESQIKPYFELNHVLENGVFFAANKLYGLTFKERKDIPVYQQDVRVFEVFDSAGKSIALWYCDYFKRDNKSGGAWEDTFVDGSGLLGTRPVVFNVANFTKPAPGDHALLTYDEVTTMFHEFGHALHSMLTTVEYPRLAGTNVPRDFVEFPSQFNEHWAIYPEVLAHYAKHYKTGKPMPKSLVEKIRNARTFNQGFATMEYLEASLLDMAWHTLPYGTAVTNVDSFETASLNNYHVYVPLIPPRYRSTYFAHIWSTGYAAGYYSYLWSEVLDDDAFAWFNDHGGLTRANGERFEKMILSRGGSEDVGGLYRAFRGRNPDVKALLEDRGLIQK
ncbi:MAG TPA: M3 family metallopeptidase [Candidatus Acidoferrales bacterium]|nr:M3 family metallopeptidase [Candidatus Acidoferrales bacterium]